MTVSKTVAPWALALILLNLAGALPASASLNLSVIAPIDVVRPNELIPVEFIVTNTDGVARTGVTVEMIYPNDLTQLFETEFDGDCPSTTCNPGETVLWTLGTIPAGGAVSFNAPAFVSGAAANGAVITFAPTATDDTLDTDSASVSVTVETASNFDILLAEDRDPSTAGADVTYKIRYGYRADAPAVSLSTLRFPLPAGTTFVAASGGGALNGGNVDWPLGILSPGDGGVRTVTVTLPAGLTAGDVVTASAEIFNNQAPAENAVSQAETVIAPAGGLRLAIEANPNPARPTELLNVDLIVTNTDPFTQFGVVLKGLTPESLSQVFETEFDGNCGSTTCTVGETITWTLGDIPAGQSVTVRFPPQVQNAAIGGTLMNLPAKVIDALGRETRQTESVRVQDDTLYDLALAENRDPAIAGDTLTYHVTFGYREDAPVANNTVLRLPLPDGASFVSATDGGALVSGAVQWSLGVLTPGDSGIREATLLLDAGLAAADIIEATAEIAGVTATAEAARAEAYTTIAASRGLQLAIESNANPGRPTELLNLALTVSNLDPFPRFGVDIVGIYPEDLSQLFETEFDGNCGATTCFEGERLTFTIGQLDAGESVTVNMPPTIANVATGGESINFYFSAIDDQGVQTRQLESVRVQTDSVYELAMSESLDPATAGAELDYKLSFAVRTDAPATTQTVLRLPLPEGTSFVSASDGGTLNGSTIEWQLGFIGPGDNGLRAATLALDGALAAGTVIEAHAEMASVSSPFERARAEANTIVASMAPLQLALEMNPDSVRLDELGEIFYTVSNRDAFTRFGVELTAIFPQNYSQSFESEFDGNCGSTTCNPGERVTFNLGDIAAGDTRTVNMQVDVVANETGDAIVPMFAMAEDDQGTQTQRADAVRIQPDTIYDVALYEDRDPAQPGDTLTYRLTYGHRDDAPAVNDATLRLNLPDGVTFLSATGGGAQNGDAVEWSLGFLSPGDQGIRDASVLIGGGVAAGTVLEASADLYSVATPDDGARSEATTTVRATTPLSLSVDPLVFTAVENRSINTHVTVTNNDALTRFGVTVRGRFPQHLSQLFESNPNFVGDCASTTCNASERITWPAVDLAAGESATFVFPPTVSAPTVDGRLINFLAWVEDDQGAQARAGVAYATGCIEELDADCDGILDSQDNCLGIANTDQRDTDGDNIGNRCDADIAQPNDCLVNPVDLGVFKAAFFGSPGDANWNPDADFNGDNVTNPVDLGILRSLFFRVPGPSALPNPCSP